MKAIHIGFIDESDSHTVAIGTGRTTNTMHIILSIMGNVVVNDNADIIDINATSHNISSHQHVGYASLEAVHHFIALLLTKIAMHLVAVNLHLLQAAGYLLHAVLLAGEDNDTLQVALLEDVIDNVQLLRIVANVGALLYLLCRTTNGNLDFHRIVKQVHSQLAYLSRHRG